MKKPRHKTLSSAKRARSASAAPEGERPDEGRWPSRRMSEVVLGVFRGGTFDAPSRVLGVTPGNSKLSDWRDDAPAAMQAGLQSRESDHRNGFIHKPKAKVGNQPMQIELLDRNLAIREDGLHPPPRRPSL